MDVNTPTTPSTTATTTTESTMTTLSDDELDLQIAKLSSDLEDLQERRKVARVHHGAIEAELRTELAKRWNQWQKRLGKQNSLTIYNRSLGDAQRLVPSRVFVQQAKLCQTLHLLEVHDRQRAHVVAENQRIVGYAQKQIQTIRDEKSQQELTMMNQLFTADAALQQLKDDLNERLLEAGEELDRSRHNSWNSLPPRRGINLNDESKQREESDRDLSSHALIIRDRALALEGLQAALDSCESSLKRGRQSYPLKLPPDLVPRKSIDRRNSLASIMTTTPGL